MSEISDYDDIHKTPPREPDAPKISGITPTENAHRGKALQDGDDAQTYTTTEPKTYSS